MEDTKIRAAELVCSLALATDLGTGQPMEHALRTCLLAQRAGTALGLEPSELRELYHVSLLRFLGCTSEAAADAALVGGSELELYAGFAPVLMGQQTEALAWMLRRLGEGRPALRRARMVLTALADTGGLDRSLATHCEAGQLLATRLGMSGEVVAALGLAFERWDGKGPSRVPGDAIPVSVRISVVARDVELLARAGGWQLAEETLRRRSGRAYDPTVVDAFIDSGPGWLVELDDGSLWERALEAEPFPGSTIPPARLDEVLGGVADFVDLKSSYTYGHSSGVARIAGEAGSALGLDGAALERVRRAALVHDLGRVGVSSWIWDRPGALSAEDWEHVRLHPYLTDRILARCSLRPELATACAHHERLDGSGYYRGVSAAQLSPEDRLLAAADAYQAMTQERPHRPARTPAEAVEELSREVEAGRLDGRSVRAIAEVAGHAHRGLERWPDGLTDREIEVLRLIAKGLSNKEVAARLVIAPKTVGRHVENVYAKIGVKTRAGAALYTMEHGLVA